MSEVAARITDNLARVRQSVGDAAQRSGRSADEITLIAVVKYVDVDAIVPLLEAGCRDLGESRPQQLCERFETLADYAPHWHLVGSLQRNKIRRVLPCAGLIHSVDSLRLVAAIDRVADETSTTADVLLEVNVSKDASKHGLTEEEVEPLLEQLTRLSRVRVRGLMAMASRTGGTSGARRDFARMRALRDRLRAECPQENVSLQELSMGMSGDFEVAIEEGATMVRIGSTLFEGLLP